jgi:hypothetical protein
MIEAGLIYEKRLTAIGRDISCGADSGSMNCLLADYCCVWPAMLNNVVRDGCLANGREHTETDLESERAVHAAASSPNGRGRHQTLTRSLMSVSRGINIQVYFRWSSIFLGERLCCTQGQARPGKAKPTNGQACQVCMPITSDRRGSDYAATESDELGA